MLLPRALAARSRWTTCRWGFLFQQQQHQQVLTGMSNKKRPLSVSSRALSSSHYYNHGPNDAVGKAPSAERFFSSSTSTTTAEKEEDEAAMVSQYLRETIPCSNAEVLEGMMTALETVYGKNLRLEQLKSFGAPGLKALAESVALELKKKQRQAGAVLNPQQRPTRQLCVTVPHHGTAFDLDWKLGDSILDLAQREELLSEYIMGTCGGQMSCCTCHVYLDKTTFGVLGGEPSETEQDMLDLAYEPQETSRLGCQVRLTPELLEAEHQITISIPGGVNDVWN